MEEILAVKRFTHSRTTYGEKRGEAKRIVTWAEVYSMAWAYITLQSSHHAK